MSDNNTVHAFKGMDKSMRCKGFQYEVGKTYETDTAKACESGFHACEAPLDVLRYYPLRDGNRYFEVEQGGKLDRNGEDSKVASTRLTVGAEIGLPGLIKAHFEYTRREAESGKKGGFGSNLAGGNRSNLAGGFGSNLAGGDRSLIVGRNGSKAQGGKNSVIVLTAWDWRGREYVPIVVKAVIIDGETYKPDTWYTLKDGEIVEVE